MSYNLKMFDSKVTVVVVKSGGYESIVQHSHEFVELVYVVSGEGENEIGNKHIPIKSGDIFVIADREVLHSIRPTGDLSSFSIINIIFPYDFYQFDYSLISPFQVFDSAKIPDAKFLIDKIAEEYTEKQWKYDLITYSLTEVLLAGIFRTLPNMNKVNMANKNASKKQMNSYIEKAETYIRQNYENEIKIDDVAKACALNTQYLQRLFKKERNTSITSYIIKYRIEQACRYLLNTDYSVAVVAQMVGFNDLKYFYVKFKLTMGETPIQYKERHRGKNERDES